MRRAVLAKGSMQFVKKAADPEPSSGFLVPAIHADWPPMMRASGRQSALWTVEKLVRKLVSGLADRKFTLPFENV